MPTNDVRLRDRELRERARAMRANPTDAERRLWAILRNGHLSGAKFRRQHVIGSCIADFISIEHRLIIEVDGSQHAGSEADRRRDAYLGRHGFRILRFWNSDVLENASGVFDTIAAALHTPHPSAALRLPPSPLTGRGVGDDHG